MFFIFLGTLGLAAIVERGRAKASAVELEPKPHLTEYLGIRLPKGWEPPIQDSLELPIEVISREKVADPRAGRRIIRVIQFARPPGDPRELLYLAVRNPDLLGEIDSFTILGEVGVVATFDIGDPESDEGWGPTRPLPGWFAAAVLPKKGPNGENLGIVIGVQGLATQGPAGKHLVRQIADGLTMRNHSIAPPPAKKDDKP